MSRIAAIFAISAMLLGAARADDASKEAKAVELMHALGLEKSFESARKTLEEQNGSFRQSLIDDIVGRPANLKDEALRNRLDQAIRRYQEKTLPPQSAEDMAARFSKGFSAHFTEQELDRLLEQYKSDLGKKEVAVTAQVTNEILIGDGKAWSDNMTKAGAELQEELTRIVTESKSHTGKRDRRK
ncbi:DUF2059 domain-containing protein [Methylocystis parvus]|uniref:DUF2059 domain-containing protein n=1 Tax=Methylocystis parvus TaxID=134 RepID=UPI003C721D6F